MQCILLTTFAGKTTCIRSPRTAPRRRVIKALGALPRTTNRQLICYNLHDSLNISAPKTVISRNQEDRNSGYRTETSNQYP